MGASAIVAAASAGSIVVISWVTASIYLFSYDKQQNGVTKDRSYAYSWTFHVESLRFVAIINLLILFAMGMLVTTYSGLDTIQDPTATVIYNLVGFNHACNYVDHNPVRMIAAIIAVPFVQVPLMLYTVFWHCRVAKDVKTGKIPKWLLNMSRVLSPFNFIVMAELHLWFVNNPDDTYGFTAHYIPYLMFQISLCLFQVLNICHQTLKGGLPWGIPSWLAWTYSLFFAVLTIVYAALVIAILVGHPTGAKLSIVADIWAISMVLGTLILSGKERLNGDVITLTVGDNMLSLESAMDDEIGTTPFLAA